MKKRNFITEAFLCAALVGLIFTGCKKDNEVSSLTDDTGQQMINAADEARFTAASDEVMDESNGVALTDSKFRGGNFQGIILGLHYPCNAVIDSSLKDQGTITVTFNGNNCANTYSRTGSVTLQLPYDAATTTVTPWSQAGSVLSITFNDFKITKLTGDKSLTFHGTKYVTNVTGGLVDDAMDFSTPIVHHVTGMIEVTFEDNTTRTWNIDRNRSFTRANSVTSVTVTGNATENGYSNVSIWGINRNGNDFTVTINTPVVLSSACNYNAMSGVRMHHKVIRELTITYGVDQNGNTGTFSGCPYGYKLNWTDKNGGAHQVVVPY
jgi:hypothetical protein